MAEYLAAVHALLGVPDGHRIQMLARIGHAPPVSPAPRLPHEVIEKTAAKYREALQRLTA